MIRNLYHIQDDNKMAVLYFPHAAWIIRNFTGNPSLISCNNLNEAHVCQAEILLNESLFIVSEN